MSSRDESATVSRTFTVKASSAFKATGRSHTWNEKVQMRGQVRWKGEEGKQEGSGREYREGGQVLKDM